MKGTLTWQANMLPGGAPSVNSGFFLTLGNMNPGGTKLPAALLEQIIVTVCPRSILVIEPIWRFPFFANILVIFCTTLMPAETHPCCKYDQQKCYFSLLSWLED